MDVTEEWSMIHKHELLERHQQHLRIMGKVEVVAPSYHHNPFFSFDSPFIPREEVQNHTALEDMWIVEDLVVYDVTSWVSINPDRVDMLRQSGELKRQIAAHPGLIHILG